MGSTASFKEESNLVSDLADTEQKALAQLKDLVAAALASGEFDLPPATDVAKAEEPAKPDAAAVGEDPKIEAAAEGETKTDALAQEEPKAEVAIEEAKPTEPAPEEKTVVVPEEEGTKTVVPTAEETVLPASVDTAVSAATEPKVEELIWGVPLAGDDERTDTVLLKFLRAREFKVKQAMAMLKAAVLWRKSFGIDALLDTDLEVPELESVVFYRGADREGHPVCYNVYSEFLDKELYDKTFGDDDKRDRFLRWRIQLLERGIREQLDFSSSGVCSMVQVTDLKNAPPMLGKHRAVTRQALTLLQDNYPEFIAKKVFINVPWWYIAANKMMSPFLTQRTMSKFTFCSPAKSAETLFRYIAPEQVPVQFGGLFKEDDTEFSTSDIVTELTVKPSSKETIEIRDSEMTSETHHLPLQLLKDITNNFSEENILGRGGFGVVYKGVLPNGSMVAVKKVVSMMSSKEQCEISQKQFENEVNILMGLKHPNIVELVGYCYEMKHLRIPHEGKYIFSWKIDSLLCLEYLPNGSLDKYISDATSGLDWHTRYKIVKGISYGLQYLHEQSDDPIIHLDLKPTNILLNADMIPKIADFGISRQFHQRKTIHTRISSGTFGYMPPEFTRGIITPMSDIFSLGVIIMEVIMGHKDYPYNIEASSKDFTNTELLKWRNMMEKEPVYTNLETDFQQIQNCIQIGLMCLNPDRTKRPTIRNVINMLQGLESLT